MTTSRQQLAAQMIDIGHFCHQRGWVPASGGNFSAKLDNNTILVTRSGVHKGYMSQADFLEVNDQGEVLSGPHQPSAETLLHCERYRAKPQIGAVLHTHSVASTLMPANQGELKLAQYELLKIFEGVDTHNCEISLPVFANSQDMQALANAVSQQNPTHAYIIAGHGIYVWGKDLRECQNRLEALEFLLDCEYQKHRWS